MLWKQKVGMDGMGGMDLAIICYKAVVHVVLKPKYPTFNNKQATVIINFGVWPLQRYI